MHFLDDFLFKEFDEHGSRVNDAFTNLNKIFFTESMFGVKLDLAGEAVKSFRSWEFFSEKLDDLVVENHHSLHVFVEIVSC